MLGLVSCLGDSYYEFTENPILTFDFKDEDKDSLFFGPFYAGYFYFINAAEMSENEPPRLDGGFGMSSRLVRWELTGEFAKPEQKPEQKPESAVSLTEEENKPYENDNLHMSVFQRMDKMTPQPNSYAVFYNSGLPEDKHHVTFLPTGAGEWTPKSCLIANTAYTVAMATKGYDISSYPQTSVSYPKYEFKRYKPAVDGTEGEDGTAAEEGDYIRIVAKGYKGDSKQETGKAEIYLVDFIDGEKDSVMTSWKPLDLSKLGEVEYIDFVVECSEQVKENGFPIYFCLDNLASGVHMKY